MPPTGRFPSKWRPTTHSAGIGAAAQSRPSMPALIFFQRAASRSSQSCVCGCRLCACGFQSRPFGPRIRANRSTTRRTLPGAGRRQDMPSAPHNPPFRADHVGSFLRPPKLLKARADRVARKISAAELREIEDAAIREVVKFQESLGLQSITDGEYRRAVFYMGFYGALGGVSAAYDTAGRQSLTFVDRQGHKLPLIIPTVERRLQWKAPIHAAEFKFLASLTARTPKMTIPSPTILHLRAGREHINRDAYPDLDLFSADIVD